MPVRAQRVAIVCSFVALPFGCEVTPGRPDDTCTYNDCGGNKASLWGMLPAATGEHPAFTVSFARNQQAFPDKQIRAGDVDQCNNDGGYSACIGLQPPGAICGPDLAHVEGTQPVVCLAVGVDGLQVPLVNGDDYHLVVKDQSGAIVVDEHWTATYEDRAPVACENRNQLTCRSGSHQFSVK